MFLGLLTGFFIQSPESTIEHNGILRVEVAHQVYCLSIEKIDILLPAFALYARLHQEPIRSICWARILSSSSRIAITRDRSVGTGREEKGRAMSSLYGMKLVVKDTPFFSFSTTISQKRLFCSILRRLMERACDYAGS
jgi:hypothetical protein